jgi:hypothetical protein
MKNAMAELMDGMFDSDDEDEFLLFTMFIHSMWLAGVMDVDVFRASQAARRNREKAKKSGVTYEDYTDSKKEQREMTKRKSNYTRFIADFIGLGVSQDGLNFAIDAVNYAEYSSLVDQKDPSVYTNRGKVMEFEAWLKNPANTPLYRYGQGWDAGPLDLGLIGILIDANKQVKEVAPKYKEAAKNKAPWMFMLSDEEQAAPTPPTPPRRISRPE